MKPMKRLGPFQPGDRCGDRYHIVRLLGQGGFGCVYEVRRLDSMRMKGVFQDHEKAFALKCLLSDYAADPRAREGLNQEAFLLDLLKHKNVVDFVESGFSEQAGDFFVMDLLEGKTLAELLKQGPLEIRQSLEIARDIANAMSFAHDKGIIHCDLKPHNIFVTNHWDVKVLDLGAAKYQFGWNSSNPDDRPPMTITQAAPEQLDESGEVDDRVDIFAVGEIAYEMLAGRHPFAGGAKTTAELRARQIQARARPLAEFNVPADVAAIVHRALSRDKRHRYASMAEMLDELDCAFDNYACRRCNHAQVVALASSKKRQETVRSHVALSNRGSREQESVRPSRAATVRISDPWAIFTQATRPEVDSIPRVAPKKMDPSLTAPVPSSLTLDRTVFDRQAVHRSLGSIKQPHAAMVTGSGSTSVRSRIMLTNARKVGWAIAGVSVVVCGMLPLRWNLMTGIRRAAEVRAAQERPISQQLEATLPSAAKQNAPKVPILALEPRNYCDGSEASVSPELTSDIGQLEKKKNSERTARPSKRQSSKEAGRRTPASASPKERDEVEWLQNPFQDASANREPDERVGELGVVPLPARSPALEGSSNSVAIISVPRKRGTPQKKPVEHLDGLIEPRWNSSIANAPTMPGDEEVR